MIKTTPFEMVFIIRDRMKYKQQLVKGILSSVCLVLLILDSKTAASGVQEGIQVCLNVIIPSLFPFFLVTTYLNHALLGMKIPGLHRIAKLLHIPEGGDSLLLLGLIGGYPVGAQLIRQTYQSGTLSKRSARILLGYCSNAGPSFIFGVTGLLFTSKWIPFFLWAIHILSALIVGAILVKPTEKRVTISKGPDISIVTALQKSISVCVPVCGWVIIFKVLLSYLNTYLFHNSGIMPLVITGFLELSNGCIGLTAITSEPIRFQLVSVFLAFGGICVLLQTKSVTGDLGFGLYIPGKLLQTLISFLLAWLFSKFIFPNGSTVSSLCVIIPGLFLACCFLVVIIHGYIEKRCGNYR